MRKRSPDHRARAVLRAAQTPEHALEAAFWRIAHKLDDRDEHVEWAWDIFQETTEREVMQAFVLAGATDADVQEVLRIPPQVTQAYRHLFFDVRAFRDELHLMSWVRNYATERHGTENGQELLQKALMEGVNGVRWWFGRAPVHVDPTDIQRQVMTDAYFRGKSHRLYGVKTAEAKAAKGFMDMALKQANALTKKPDTSGIGALLIRLRHREMTTPIEEVRPDDAPLH